MRLSFFFLVFCSMLHAQSDNWVEQTQLFRDINPYETGGYIFEDGSFQLTKGNYRFKFDKQGVVQNLLTQEIIEQEVPLEQRSSGCSAFDLVNNVRYTLADNIIHVERMFPDRKNEYRAIPLEKQEHVVKSVWDQYSNNSNHVDAGIITSVKGKIILYQTYFAISVNTHPGKFKPKGINTYMRLSIVNLEDYSVSYEYLLIDVFNPAYGKKKEVLDFFDFKCIGTNAKQELLFSISKTSFKDRDAPPLSLSDYKGVDYCKSGIDIWTVNLNDYSQKKVYSTIIESNKNAASVSLNFGNDGWLLSWTEHREDYYTFHTRSFQIDTDYDVQETVIHFPSKEFRLEKFQTPNLRVYKDLNGKEWFCSAIPGSPAIYMLDQNSQLKVFGNELLKWDLNKHFVLSNAEMLCLPCLKELSAEDIHLLSDLPEAISPGTPHTRILKLRKAGNSVLVLHLESLDHTTETGVARIRQLFLKTGKINL
ncbi:hypothetical protein [Fluviicola sp.]|uniref:hypothetical protein n=1 Tax=Fluviicola sp. TaxID=1917219 RepID=UPI0031D1BA18